MNYSAGENEDARLKALRDYNILDSLPDEQFDRLTRLAAAICEVPMSLLCLIDKDRQWFKSKVGISLTQTHRNISFCQYTIRQNDFLEIQDTLTDSRVKENPLVLQNPNIRFYAGYPLIDPEGFALGTLCVLDRKPRKLSTLQKETLKTLAEDIMSQIINNKKNEERKKLEKFFLMSIDMICIADLNGYFTKINPAFSNTLGWSTEELLTRPYLELVHPDDLENTKKELADLSGGTQTLNFTNRFRTKKGKYILLDWVANPDSDAGEIFAIARDVTVLTKIISDFEVFASEKEQLNKALNESTIVSITDGNGKIKFVNDSFCEISGYSREELVGKVQDFLYSEFYDQQYLDERQKSLREGNIWKGIMKNRAKNGTLFWVDTTVVPVLDQNKMLEKNIFIRHDITQRVLLEEALRNSKEEIEKTSDIKEQFLANMSHEIRTPLNAIIGFSEILSNTELSNEQKESVRIISMAGETLIRIINDILDFTKIESGNIIMERINVNLDTILENIYQIFSKSAREKNIDLKILKGKGLPVTVITDPVRLTQVLINLTGNAIKFTDNGRVEIHCDILASTPDTTLVEFRILDSGIGIAADKLEIIFDRFVQAEENTSRKFGGTGLGLSITKTLVELFGGKILCKSRLGAGAEFIVQIPFPTAVISESSAKLPEESEQFPAGLNVLLVEDHKLNQKLTEKIILNAGGQIEIAANGLMAIELLGKKKYDIILLDLQMPLMDGYETAKQIRNKLKLNVPIIAMTANALHGEKEKCLAAGMNDYISKPFKSTDLIKIICQHLTGKPGCESNSLYSLTALKEISGGDNAFVEDFIHSFISEVSTSMKDMYKSFSENNLENVRSIAHKIKPAFGLLNAMDASEICEEIEHSQQNNISNKIDSLNNFSNQLIRSLRADFQVTES